MKTVRAAASLQNLRTLPLWKLLAANNAPIYMALMQVLFVEGQRSIPASELLERLTREIGQIQTSNAETLPTPQWHLAEWLRQGWLIRRLLPGAAEEEYEISADAADAIRFISALSQPRVSVTESRLAVVIQQFTKLAESTDTNPESRLAALRAERDRIDREMEKIALEGVQALPDDRALEWVREAIMLAADLTGDFPRMRDKLEQLNRQLREELLANEGARGKVLAEFFDAYDLIENSEEGRTFNAFWRLLNDQEMAATLDVAINDILKRPFADGMTDRERRFLLHMKQILFREGLVVSTSFHNISRNLNSFVQSREYLEQRRLRQVFRDTQRIMLEARGRIQPFQHIGFDLVRTTSEIDSISRWELKDPADRMVFASMQETEQGNVDLASLAEAIRLADIDYREIRHNIRNVLDIQSQASIRQVLEIHPATQGLGTIVGYMEMAAKHGETTDALEVVSWVGRDGVARSARINTCYFTRERQHELIERI